MLSAFGARVDYLVPNRFEYGYGLTPEIVRLAAATKSPDIIITVDNGIASIDGVAEAARLSIDVVVTDHHLPGAGLPEARAIVNPNQPGCAFASKNLAGVGVMFYLMTALRAELRRRDWFAGRSEPSLATVLDLVALGTVADVVRLDTNNRLLVHHGLRRIREGLGQPGIRALYRAAGRDPRRASAYDLGFMLGPRLNAAGRLSDMSLGIECLITQSEARALEIASELDTLNRERRSIEQSMHEEALGQLETLTFRNGFSVCLYQPTWHQGVIGVLASRIKDRFHRPTIAFARAAGDMLKGSGRSIRGFHLRDALDAVSKRAPGLIERFGGHAAAAGLTIAEAKYASFVQHFETVCQTLLDPRDLAQRIETDGPLSHDELNLDAADMLEAQIWGQGFAPPTFDGEFELLAQRIVGGRHSRLTLGSRTAPLEAMLFGVTDALPRRIRAVYRLGIDEFRGARRLQLVIEHWQDAA
jgi:single-stranded-DNA-specific exonuclease